MTHQNQPEQPGVPPSTVCDYATNPLQLTSTAASIASLATGPRANSAEVNDALNASSCEGCPRIREATGACALRQGVADTLFVQEIREVSEMINPQAAPEWLTLWRIRESNQSGTRIKEVPQVSEYATGRELLRVRQQRPEHIARFYDTLGGIYNSRAENTAVGDLPKVLKDALRMPDDTEVRTDVIQFANDRQMLMTSEYSAERRTYAVSDFSARSGAEKLNSKTTASLMADLVRLLQHTDINSNPRLVSTEQHSGPKSSDIMARLDDGVVIVRVNGERNERRGRVMSALYVAYLPTKSDKPARVLIFGGYENGDEPDFLHRTGLGTLIDDTRR